MTSVEQPDPAPQDGPQQWASRRARVLVIDRATGTENMRGTAVSYRPAVGPMLDVVPDDAPEDTIVSVSAQDVEVERDVDVAALDALVAVPGISPERARAAIKFLARAGFDIVARPTRGDTP